jgi:acylphosphatase
MSEASPLRLHAWVSGRVQGVGFRYFVMQNAQTLGLTGWVRNLHDGRVEVLAEGEHDALNGFLVQLRRGPVSAFVEDVQYDFSNARGDYPRFSVLPTG